MSVWSDENKSEIKVVCRQMRPRFSFLLIGLLIIIVKVHKNSLREKQINIGRLE